MFAVSVHNSLMKHRFLFKTVILTVRFEDFSTYTAQRLSQFGLQIFL
jgi:hypothetical protein